MNHIETGSFAAREACSSPSDSLRIVSWNINRGSRFNFIVEFLADARADLVLLQECDLNTLRTGRLNIAREIAQKLRMDYVFGLEFVELSQQDGHTSAYHGQATLSRTQLVNPRILRFDRQSKFWSPRWFVPSIAAFQRRLGGRMALVSETVVEGKKLVLYNLHLESRNSNRLRYQQLCEVLEDTRQYSPDASVVLAGDFNFDVTQGPSSRAIKSATFCNPFGHECNQTTKARQIFRHSHAIDWILVRGALHSECARVHSSTSGSDHYPLSMELRLSTSI
ncbi:MAG TPA: endonuclease/exonuclease/phosphatase family protein [Terriglobales bacterium]|nr:endonuclease/exonuclease/phosphatase family protein [Terriglobales bacterium]